ncbi:MAG: OmpA family protein [Myxococcota bacterium]
MLGETAVVGRVEGGWESTTLSTGASHTLILKRRVAERIRVTGMFFETEKSFVLPGALAGLQRLVTLSDAGSAKEIVVVGHTDASGSRSYNLQLSLQRARSMAAYLRDDVDAWLDNYSLSDADERWGSREDSLMLGALPMSRSTPYLDDTTELHDAAAEFQRDAGLEPTGMIDEPTRRALIEAYMGLDGTTLPEPVRVLCHGCGEFFPTEDSTGPTDPRDRRVELFCFDRAIDPEPPSEAPSKADSPYPKWLGAVSKTHELSVDGEGDELRLTLLDDGGEPMPGAPFVVRFAGSMPFVGHADGEGVAHIPTPAICSEDVAVSWGGPGAQEGHAYHRRIFVDCDAGDEPAKIERKLHNLGFSPDLGLDAAVRAFQREHEVDDEPVPVGAPQGQLPAGTAARLDEVFDELSREQVG